MFMAASASLTLLFVGRMISGITPATIGARFAYKADAPGRTVELAALILPGAFAVAPATRRKPVDAPPW